MLRSSSRRRPSAAALGLLQVFAPLIALQAQEGDIQDRWQERTDRFHAEGLAEPYRGIIVDGQLREDLFPLRQSGVSTEPVRRAALAFVDTLTDEQRSRSLFDVDSPEWRMWNNQHAYVRQGTAFLEMTGQQRDAALQLLRASLSAKGLKLTTDIMHLNTTLAELVADNAPEYGEGRYWISLMGTPSETEPWGWQLDGHHAIINYFVLGDQVVMTPTFLGSEPVIARSGKYAGTQILEAEQEDALAFFESLSMEQRTRAVLKTGKDGANNVAEAFRDNLDLDESGISARDLSPGQRSDLLALIGLYVGNMDDGHAAVKMSEVERHLDETRFTWIGESGPDSVFYYRILSPVILIEFDHQHPIALRDVNPPGPGREHIHTVVRTPNGNDYGKDLLRQHHEQQPHSH